MKKYLLILAMVLTTTAVLGGCGKKTKEDKKEDKKTEASEDVAGEQQQPAPPSMDGIDLDKIVELMDYKGLVLEKEVAMATEEELKAKMDSMLLTNPEAVGDDAVVEEGDVVNIDYEGKIDGVAFEGGKAEGANIVIGSGTLMDGFEDGLVGTKKGQTFDLDITFPEGYSEDLGGKPAVFTIKINDIKRPLDEPTDEWIAANTEYKTVDEYKASIEKEILEVNQLRGDELLQQEAFQMVFEGSKIKEYPEKVMTYAKKLASQQAEQYAKSANMTLEEMLEAQGVKMEDYEKQTEESAKAVATQVLVMNAIAKKEGLKESDPEYKDVLEEFKGYANLSEKELFEQHGEEMIKQSIMMRRVNELLVTYAKITEVPAKVEEDIQSPIGDEELPETQEEVAETEAPEETKK